MSEHQKCWKRRVAHSVKAVRPAPAPVAIITQVFTLNILVVGLDARQLELFPVGQQVVLACTQWCSQNVADTAKAERSKQDAKVPSGGKHLKVYAEFGVFSRRHYLYAWVASIEGSSAACEVSLEQSRGEPPKSPILCSDHACVIGMYCEFQHIMKLCR